MFSIPNKISTDEFINYQAITSFLFPNQLWVQSVWDTLKMNLYLLELYTG